VSEKDTHGRAPAEAASLTSGLTCASRTGPDVLVAGAGPGGCVAALAFAARGAAVQILDPLSGPRPGLSGEWLQPAGVSALRRLGVELPDGRFSFNRGFIVHPGDGGAPIELHYPSGMAVSMRHSVLTDVLRTAVEDHASITVTPGRVIGGRPAAGELHTSCGTLYTGVAVGADGRSSAVRRALRADRPASVPLSHTAGFLLPGAELPKEGYGHVFLGGAGPVLVYRVAPDALRMCVDVPLGAPNPSKVFRYLHRGYAHVLPPPLREGFLGQLHPHNVQWAANRFLRRTDYGHGRCALVGDAVGYSHPLAALGMALAILDGECLGHSTSLAVYARERTTQSWAAERLGAAIHRVVTEDDAASRTLRQALFRLWRCDPDERDRTMALLSMTDARRRSFMACVAHIAREASGLHVEGTYPRRRPVTTSRSLVPLASWLLCLSGPYAGIPQDWKSPVPAGQLKGQIARVGEERFMAHDTHLAEEPSKPGREPAPATAREI